MQHPNDKQLQLFITAQLEVEEEKGIEEHLDRCSECSDRVSKLERTPGEALLQTIKVVVTSADDSTAETVVPSVTPLNSGRSAPTLLMPGDTLDGTLRLEEKLGQGGMGETWKAYDMTAERHVVLKFVLGEMQHAKEAMASVHSSFQKIHTLQHQHICPVYKLVDDPKYGFSLEMKYIDGVTLADYRRRIADKNAKMPFQEIVSILRDVAEGLDYAHKRKVIHRDIKPGNIMIGREDGVQIIDFGLAEKIRPEATDSDEEVVEVSGTRPYMAPEQWEKKTQDARTDQYALAVMAYELLAGHRPFQESDPERLRERVLNDKPEPIVGIPEHVNAALAKALSKKREDRFPDCKSFVEAFSKTVSHRSKIAGIAVLAFVAVCALYFGLFRNPPENFSSSTGVAEAIPIGAPGMESAPVAEGGPPEKWRPDLEAAPADFRKKLQAVEDFIEKEGGYAVAGRVFIDGEPAKRHGDFDVQPNRELSYHFEQGWFITDMCPDVPEGDINVQAIGIQSAMLETTMTVEPGKVNYIKIDLSKAPGDKLADMTGRVVMEDGKPVANVAVEASYPIGKGYHFFTQTPENTFTPNLTLAGPVVTNEDGKFLFKQLFKRNWDVGIVSNALTGWTNIDHGTLSIIPDIVVLYNRRVVIDTVYQPDGSPRFDKDNIIKGSYELILFHNKSIAQGETKAGMGIVFDPTEESRKLDMAFRIGHAKWMFGHRHISNNPYGHYDLGAVNFDSVTEADPEKIRKEDSLCQLNHVYVVRTNEKGHYAKFVVRSIEIIDFPDDSHPLESGAETRKPH